VAAVIPAMDRLTNNLRQATKKIFHPAIVSAMGLARKKLDRYYSLTDSSTVYRIAMVLHPGMKLEYFRQQGWEDDWIEQAESLVRDEYAAFYKKPVQPTASEDPSVCIPFADCLAVSKQPFQGDKPSKKNGFMAFGNLSVTSAARISEIDDYLRLPVEIVTDPLKWWCDNQHVYPGLSQMALDYLSAPGEYISLPRERVANGIDSNINGR
jgi:hypothetical protein